MQILTPEKIRALETVVGLGRPQLVRTAVLGELIADGFVDTMFLPTQTGVRATAPHFMKDITPCN